MIKVTILLLAFLCLGCQSTSPYLVPTQWTGSQNWNGGQNWNAQIFHPQQQQQTWQGSQFPNYNNYYNTPYPLCNQYPYNGQQNWNNLNGQNWNGQQQQNWNNWPQNQQQNWPQNGQQNGYQNQQYWPQNGYQNQQYWPQNGYQNQQNWPQQFWPQGYQNGQQQSQIPQCSTEIQKCFVNLPEYWSAFQSIENNPTLTKSDITEHKKLLVQRLSDDVQKCYKDGLESEKKCKKDDNKTIAKLSSTAKTAYNKIKKIEENKKITKPDEYKQIQKELAALNLNFIQELFTKVPSLRKYQPQTFQQPYQGAYPQQNQWYH